MYAGQRFLGLVPARGGSVGLPGKHLLDLGGRPVLAWTADAALASQLLDRVVLSTDDEELAAAGRELGLDVPFRRPAELATAEARSGDVIAHALTSLDGQWDAVVLLQPTSPLRTADDIDDAIRIFADHDAPACVSVTPVRQHPAWTYRVEDDLQLQPYAGADAPHQRQGLEQVHALNGAVYVLRADADFGKDLVVPGTMAHVMPVERSVDLDTEHDLRILRALVEAAP